MSKTFLGALILFMAVTAAADDINIAKNTTCKGVGRKFGPTAENTCNTCYERYRSEYQACARYCPTTNPVMQDDCLSRCLERLDEQVSYCFSQTLSLPH